jgi:hypothetical protein
MHIHAILRDFTRFYAIFFKTRVESRGWVDFLYILKNSLKLHAYPRDFFIFFIFFKKLHAYPRDFLYIYF